MATRNRQGFEDLGREHAKNGDVRRYKASDASWQARAYNTGWDLGKGDLTASLPTKAAMYSAGYRHPGKSRVPAFVAALSATTSPKEPEDERTQVWFDELKHLPNSTVKTTGINIERMAANTMGWPTGAKEHALFLAKQANVETNPARRARLERAICRLQTRHMKTATP